MHTLSTFAVKPLIAITVESRYDPEDARTRGNIKLNWNYFQMVSEAGGVPLVIPPTADMEEVAKLVHGWLIPGGLDMDAAHWGEANHPKSELQDPSRWESERALYEALPEAVPILGICYGCQFLNVVRGGSLIQHLPDELGNESHGGGNLQTYGIDSGSKFATVAGVTETQGQSWHHQAIGRLGEGLRVVSEHEDGTVEAIESTDERWLLAAQWHPERTPESEATQNLFRAFIQAAARYAANR
ncbi:gamma-glutamyl-gamma-aminobutyrate hydrolase family protein [bacterium]|nr:MAG: gamma-glutamyl-gamma-aminobutyrate hydrolase family protein [bacterium]